MALAVIIMCGLCVQVSAVQTVSHRDQWLLLSSSCVVCVCGLCVQVSAVQTVSHRDQWLLLSVAHLSATNVSLCFGVLSAVQHAVKVQYNGSQLIHWLQM